VFAGIIPGLAFAGASSVPAVVLVAGWFIGRLGVATGIVSAAIPAGQSLFLPLVTAMIPALGWRETYIVLGLVVVAIGMPIMLWLARDPPVLFATGRIAFQRPRAGPDVWLVAAGYVGCGLSDQFISIHFVALAADRGVDPLTAAGLLSFLLLVALIGSVASGPFADRVQPKHLLAGLYMIRAATLPLLLFAGRGAGLLVLVVFALLFGPTYIANQAPGARLVRDRYGVRSVGLLMGSVGLAHQVGGALGVALGGYSVAELGTYAPAVVAVTAVVFVGGLLQLAIPAQHARAT
jgi:predicted MFS family arabinose efflux permease